MALAGNNANIPAPRRIFTNETLCYTLDCPLRLHVLSRKLSRHSRAPLITSYGQPPFPSLLGRHSRLSRLSALKARRTRSTSSYTRINLTPTKTHNSLPNSQPLRCHLTESTSTTSLHPVQTMLRSTQLSSSSTVRLQLARPSTIATNL